LDGNSLTPEVVYHKLSTGRYSIQLTEQSWKRVRAARKVRGAAATSHMHTLQLLQRGEGHGQVPFMHLHWTMMCPIHLYAPPCTALQVVDDKIASGDIVYGVNTGVGNFARVILPADKYALVLCARSPSKQPPTATCCGPDMSLLPCPGRRLAELQVRIIRSHACGIGEPLAVNRARMLMAIRINVLAKGYSGVGEDTLQVYINAFNKDCIPKVPAQVHHLLYLLAS
jgi:aromatic amino acid lyase